MVGEKSPVSRLDEYAREQNEVRRRVSDLERSAGRWPSPPGVSATKSTTQAIPTGTATVVTFPDTEDYDKLGMHSTSVNPGRITIPTGFTGIWTFSGGFYAAVAPAAASIEMYYQKNNNSGARWGWVKTPAPLGIDLAVNATADIPCVAGDYIELLAFHAAGVSWTIGFSGIPVRFTATYRGAS